MKQSKSYRWFQNEMLSKYSMWCIQDIKNGNERVSATCYHVITLKVFAVWVNGKGIVYQCNQE